jgi:hypothetical protein
MTAQYASHKASSLIAMFLFAFSGVVQAQFTYTTNNGTITITKYTGPGGVVIIPTVTNGLPVTGIGDQAFSFTGGGGPPIILASVTIPDTVTSIGSKAFYGSTSLTNVTIGTNVTDIGEEAFASCTILTNISIPASVTSLGNGAFVSCFRLVAITVDVQNSFYSSVNGVLFDKTQSTLIQYPAGLGGNYTIPNSVASIGSNAFYVSTSLTNVTIGTSVTDIGGNAFHECTNLTSITIPDSVTSIEVGAFAYCTSLTRATIGNGVTNIGPYAFYDCASLTSVIIPDSVTSIGYDSFAYCTSVTNVTIGANLTSVGYAGFALCPGLTSIVIPKTVTNLESYAYYSDSSLTGAYFEGNAPSGDSTVFSGDNVTIYYLPGTTGWGATFCGRPTALWLPQVQTGDSFGVRTNQFGFNIHWASGMVVVVEAATNLAENIWSPVETNTIVSGSSYFGDPAWTNYPSRFYRIRWP